MPLARRVTTVVCSLLIASTLASGCGNDKRDEPTPSLSTDSSTVMPSSPASSESAPAVFPRRDEIHGIVVARVGEQGIGVIDPQTGVYTRLGSLPPNVNANSGRFFSPDFQKVADTNSVNNTKHAGWFNADGSFVDMTPELATDEFGTNISAAVIGFDGQNRFYWSITESAENYSDNRVKYYRIDANNPSGPRQEVSAAEAAWRGPAGYPSKRGADGSLYPPDCVKNAYSSHAPDTYFGVANSNISNGPANVGTQILRVSGVTASASGDCAEGAQQKYILPETSDINVTQPVPSPDGSQVAFFSTAGALYIVDGFGRSRPTKLIDSFPDAALFEWL